jgi:hypothetical protein
VGECTAGEQTCSGEGAWGVCAGEQGPTEELCDGKDNDCDGLTDLGPVKVLLSNNTGPFEGHWRLHGHDAGYTVVTPLVLPDGGFDWRALRFDRQFSSLGQSSTIVEGEPRRVDSMVGGGMVYVSYRTGVDVALTRVSPDGALRLIATVPDAGYDSHLQVGVGPWGVRSSWVTDGASVRVARWDLSGAPPTVSDLALIPNATIWWLDSTTDGQFSIIEAEAADGGLIEAVHNNDEPTPRTLLAPYWSARRFMTRKSGQIVHLDTLKLELTGDERKVVFWRDFAAQLTGGHYVVETAGRWYDSDFTLDVNEDVIAVYVDEATQRFVFARIEGTTFTDMQVTRRVPEDNVVVPLSSSQGNVRVTRVPGDPMFGLAWSTRNQLSARRFCGP